ncbi:unnamed protein product [Rhodiola kirilowii]
MEVAGAATCRVWLSLLRCGDNRSSKQCLAESFSVGELGFGNHRKLLVNRLTVCCGEKKKERKEKKKLVKGLEKDLAMFAALGFGIESGRSHLARQVQGSMMTEAAEVLLRQLQCLREAEEEAKRKRKQEKKAMIRMMEDFGIKASTDSGDGEKSTDFNSSWKEEYLSRSAVGGNSSAGEAVGQVLLQSLDHDTEVQQQEEVAQLLITASPSQQNSTTFRRNKSGTKKVEICMSGKCKKFGASQVLDKFKSLAAEEEDMNVVGCKCMGKCKEGPNVRLSSVSTAAPAICSGVQIGDVDALITSFLDIN